jgi:Asp-tRNA(Asn)/Glu-tRNA(Gln) amidotransferase A subunit family amidase
VAKAQCAELAYRLSGRNVHCGTPQNPAVAGNLCDLGLATDTLGSIRIIDAGDKPHGVAYRK